MTVGACACVCEGECEPAATPHATTPAHATMKKPAAAAAGPAPTREPPADDPSGPQPSGERRRRTRRMGVLNSCLVERDGDLFVKVSHEQRTQYLARLLKHRANFLTRGETILKPSEMQAAYVSAQAEFEEPARSRQPPSRAEQNRAEQSRTELSRAEQSRQIRV